MIAPMIAPMIPIAPIAPIAPMIPMIPIALIIINYYKTRTQRGIMPQFW